jgi:hypothetical protein
MNHGFGGRVVGLWLSLGLACCGEERAAVVGSFKGVGYSVVGGIERNAAGQGKILLLLQPDLHFDWASFLNLAIMRTISGKCPSLLIFIRRYLGRLMYLFEGLHMT